VVVVVVVVGGEGEGAVKQRIAVMVRVPSFSQHTAVGDRYANPSSYSSYCLGS